MIVEVPPGAARVSIRRATPDGPRDLVGTLLAANAQWQVVLPEDGPAVWVPRTEVEAMRRVPDRTVLPGSTPADVERFLERLRPSGRRYRLGGWRIADDAVLALGDPGLTAAQAVAAVEAHLGHRAVVRTPADPSPDLRDALAARPARSRVVLTSSAPADISGAVPLTRGWALDLDADDAEALAAASASGFSAHHRALVFSAR